MQARRLLFLTRSQANNSNNKNLVPHSDRVGQSRCLVCVWQAASKTILELSRKCKRAGSGNGLESVPAEWRKRLMATSGTMITMSAPCFVLQAVSLPSLVSLVSRTLPTVQLQQAARRRRRYRTLARTIGAANNKETTSSSSSNNKLWAACRCIRVTRRAARSSWLQG